MKTLTVFLLASGLAILSPLSLSAQEQDKLLLLRAPCAPFEDMVETVTKYNEVPLFIGTNGSTFASATGQEYVGGMFFTVNQESEKRSWTMFQIFADGMTCMLFNGYGFQPYMGD